VRVATVELIEGVAVRGREIRALVEENQEVQYILKPLPSKSTQIPRAQLDPVFLPHHQGSEFRRSRPIPRYFIRVAPVLRSQVAETHSVKSRLSL
jgi:hypothetical protein